MSVSTYSCRYVCASVRMLMSKRGRERQGWGDRSTVAGGQRIACCLLWRGAIALCKPNEGERKAAAATATTTSYSDQVQAVLESGPGGGGPQRTQDSSLELPLPWHELLRAWSRYAAELSERVCALQALCL